MGSSALHFMLEIDGDIHPELHALLRVVTQPEKRSERLRQLASAGLIWERLRIEGWTSSMRSPTTSPSTPSEERRGPPADRGLIPALIDVVDPAASVEGSASEAQTIGEALQRGPSLRLKRMVEKGLFSGG